MGGIQGTIKPDVDGQLHEYFTLIHCQIRTRGEGMWGPKIPKCCEYQMSIVSNMTLKSSNALDLHCT